MILWKKREVPLVIWNLLLSIVFLTSFNIILVDWLVEVERTIPNIFDAILLYLFTEMPDFILIIVLGIFITNLLQYTIKIFNPFKFWNNQITVESQKFIVALGIFKWFCYAIVAIVASPHLPGAGTPYLAGITALIGFSFSISATTAISDLIAGMILIYMVQINNNDWVEIGEIKGQVIEQNIFVHRILTFDGTIVSFPNSKILNNIVVNYSDSTKLKFNKQGNVDIKLTNDNLSKEKPISTSSFAINLSIKIDHKYPPFLIISSLIEATNKVDDILSIYESSFFLPSHNNLYIGKLRSELVQKMIDNAKDGIKQPLVKDVFSKVPNNHKRSLTIGESENKDLEIIIRNRDQKLIYSVNKDTNLSRNLIDSIIRYSDYLDSPISKYLYKSPYKIDYYKVIDDIKTKAKYSLTNECFEYIRNPEYIEDLTPIEISQDFSLSVVNVDAPQVMLESINETNKTYTLSVYTQKPDKIPEIRAKLNKEISIILMSKGIKQIIPLYQKKLEA